MVRKMTNAILALLILFITFLMVFWLLRPVNGLFWRWKKARRVSQRVLREDALKHLHRCQRYGRAASLESVAGALQISTDQASELIADLQLSGLLEADGNTYSLTSEGQDYALHVIRAHRLWERYLADETGFSSEAWHDQADRAEHDLTREETAALAAALGNPTHDPHGDPIPTANGVMVAHGGRPLTEATLFQPLRIVHLEDEPETVFAQLMAEGLNPGMEVQLLEISLRRVRFWANGNEHVLAPVVASSISVIPIKQFDFEDEQETQPLSSLALGEAGEVVRISKTSRGSERRRFLDLGILPGTIIKAEMTSPSGDPTAYRIREALIALRKEQAEQIRIQRSEVDPTGVG